MARRVGITCELEEITPALAEKYLKRNKSNRPIRQREWEGWARNMQNGTWEINGDVLRFASNGDLLDGQHRLLAVIAAQTTVKMFVVRGLSPKTQETMDLGARRSFGDTLKLRGEEYYSSLAAITRMHWILENTTNPLTRNIQPTVQELVTHLDANPELRLATKLTDKTRTAVRIPSSAIGPVIYNGLRIDENDALFFIEKLMDGSNLEADSPIYALRKFFLKYAQERGTLRTEILLAYAIKAWNAYREGSSLTHIRFRSGGAKPEPFPVMK